jgi:hypothetical protein
VIGVGVSSLQESCSQSVDDFIFPKKSVKVNVGALQDMLLAWRPDFRQVMAL